MIHRSTCVFGLLVPLLAVKWFLGGVLCHGSMKSWFSCIACFGLTGRWASSSTLGLQQHRGSSGSHRCCFCLFSLRSFPFMVGVQFQCQIGDENSLEVNGWPFMVHAYELVLGSPLDVWSPKCQAGYSCCHAMFWIHCSCTCSLLTHVPCTLVYFRLYYFEFKCNGDTVYHVIILWL